MLARGIFPSVVLSIRLYEARPGGPIMRAIYVNGKEDRRSLRHRDKELAVKQGYELLAALLKNEQAIEDGTLTHSAGWLTSTSRARATSASKERTQLADKQKLERVAVFLDRARNVESLSESDVRRFTMARRKGQETLPDVEEGRQVSDTTIGADLIALMTALNWAVRERTSTGRRLLREIRSTASGCRKRRTRDGRS